MTCLDFEKYDKQNKYKKPIILFGANGADYNDYLEIALVPCKEGEGDCRVGDFRKEGKIDKRDLWDQIG